MQFIPRLSSTSINNKHLHESRASLGGRRRHHPARSTSDATLCLLGPYAAAAFAFRMTCLPLPRPPGAIFTYAPSHLSKAAALSALTETSQCLCWWRRTPVAHDKRQTLSSRIPLRLWCGLFLSIIRRSCHVIDGWCSVCDMTGGRAARELRNGGKVCLLTRKYPVGC